MENIRRVVIEPTEKDLERINIELLKSQIKKETSKLQREFKKKWLMGE